VFIFNQHFLSASSALFKAAKKDIPTFNFISTINQNLDESGHEAQILLVISKYPLIDFFCKRNFFTLNHATTAEQKQVAVTFD